MASQKLNIQVDQGTDYTETIIAKNPDGSVLDVTGFTAAGQIRKSYTSTSATNFTVTFGTRSAGEVIIGLARAQTSSLEAGRYVYDVEITSSANKRTRLAEGQVTVTQEVTREGPIDFVNEVLITDPQDGAFLIYESANTNWVDSTQIRATSNTVLDVTGTLEADGFSGTGAVTVTDFIDDDSFGTANNTNIATAESVKAYVDATSAGKDALAELVDTNITTPSSGQFIIHDGTDSFDNKTISGDIAITNQGVASITAGSIVNADVNASAGIEISKTALVGGTGITLSGNTVSLTANSALTNLGGDSANTTHILRKDGTFIQAFTAGTGLDINSDNEFSLSTGAALTNLGYQDNQVEFLRRDGAWVQTKQYYGATGITITPNSNTNFQEGKDAISLTSGAALSDLGGGIAGDGNKFLNERGAFIIPPDNNTTYTAGTGLNLDGTTFSLGTNVALDNLGGQFANNTLGDVFLSANGSFLRPIPIVEAGTGLTLTANTSLTTNSVFSVNTNLSHVVGTGALNSGSITSGFGDINVGANTVTAGSLDINGSGDVSGNLTVHGNFTVNGTETVVNSTTLSVDDKNIVLGSVDTPTDTTADGGGITLKGATDKTINWVNSTDSWTSSEHFTLASGKQLRIAASSSLSSPDSAVRIDTGGDGGSLFIFGYNSNHYIDFNSGGGSLYIGDTSSTDYATIHLADGFKTIGGTTEIFSPNFGADVLPILSLHRDSASPATNDKLGIIKFNGEDSAGNKTEYATIHAEIADPTSGAEYGRLDFGILNNGTVEDPVMTLAPAGILLGSDNDLILGQNGNIQFEGNTSGSSIRTTLYCDDPNTNREIILPNASGTVVLKDSTDTLTNKSIDAGQLTGTIDDARIPDTVTSAVQTALTTSALGGLTMSAVGSTTGGAVVFREGTNNGTNAIKLQAPAQVDGAGSFGTLDITFPNAAGTMALTSDLSSFITASSSDTLTNKSIAATQLTGTIDNARLPAAATNITSVGTLTGLTTGATTVNGDITLNGTDAGSTAPNLDFYHLSASPAVNDNAGTINFFADNASNEKIIYGQIEARSQSTTNGQEEGLIAISPRVSHGGADLTSTSDVLTVRSISGSQVGEVEVLNNLVVSSGTAGGTFAGGPTLTLSREELFEGVDNDEFGVISFKAFNDRGLSSGGPESIEYAHMHAKILDASDGTEDGQLEFGTIANGSLVEPLMTMNSSELSVNTPLTVNATTQSLSDTTSNSNSAYGPNIEVYRDGGAATSTGTSITQHNKLGAIDFFGNNDAGTPEKIKYAKVFGSVITKTDGSEDGRLSFSVMTAGTHTEGANPASILDLEPDVAVFKQDVRIVANASGGVNATPTPILELYQEDGPSADDGDHLGEIQFTALNDNGFSPIKHKYAGIHAEIIDESNATEDGSLHFTTVTAGTEDTTVLTLNGTGSTLSTPLEVTGGITANPTTVVISAANTTYTMEANKKVLNTHTGGVNIFKIPSVSTVGQIFTVVNSTTQALTLDKTTNSITLNFASGGSFAALSANSTIASGGVAELVVTGSDTLTIFGGGIS